MAARKSLNLLSIGADDSASTTCRVIDNSSCSGTQISSVQDSHSDFTDIGNGPERTLSDRVRLTRTA